jgi:hypothetical protein
MKIIENCITEELAEECIKEIEFKKRKPIWLSSSCFWPEGIKINVEGSCIQCDISKNLKKKIYKQISPHLPEYSRLSSQFYIWQNNSAISNHNDHGYGFGVTIYLNKEWDVDWGGIFLWNNEDDQSEKYYKSWKACCPKYRNMILNENLHDHLVTPVSPLSPSFRYTIQLWGHK